MKDFDQTNSPEATFSIPQDSCTTEVIESDNDAATAPSSSQEPVPVKRVQRSPYHAELSLFCPGKRPSASDDYMEAVRANDMNAIRVASIDGLDLADFERAFELLNRYNPDWRGRPAGDVTRGVIAGLENEIKRMQAQSSSPTL